MSVLLINPGTGPVRDATKEQAFENMNAFIRELPHGMWRYLDRERDGRYSFQIVHQGRHCDIEMPGVEVAQKGEPFVSPRLYVDGSSWLWGYALKAAERALFPEKEEKEVAMTDSVAIVDHRGRELEPAKVDGAPNPAALIQLAVEKGAAVDQLERLLALQERWEATEARKAYVRAMAAFKKRAPRIVKRKLVNAGQASYKHPTLGGISDEITEPLAHCGLTADWDLDQRDDRIRVTCIVRHEQGHEKRVTLESGPDKTGSKNSIQAIGSAVTYLERYTLQAALGLVSHDEEDDDGQAAGAFDGGAPAKPSTKEPSQQRKAIHAATVDQREEIGRLQDLASDSGLDSVAEYLGKALESKLTQPRAAELIKRAQDKIAEATAEPEEGSGECQHTNVNDAGRCMDCGQGVPGCSL